ncbi:helix-turn-helix transcriptional regulator [Pseudaminobacter sp. 19-2017]|uniref:Helix-turn-helix transcriptional regulator n=1 Tax=Pseudaminobacter soli (ex Zhang et al. 2022) TaxID=2831468 RepID=A0A942I9F1_9HYPH|nr:XRE family transcriptional regulator [Pseudaminobacter soli]MBS3650255.1 helix-turn-helix transcriptional regulator [Pseudaminobacter soli]
MAGDSAEQAAGDQRDALQKLASRIRHLRSARKLSLRDLADLAGTSASFLSQLERGLTGASTSTLNQIASALGISVAELFEERSAAAHRVLKRSQRPSLPPTDGCRKTLLSARPVRNFEVYIGEFEIGGSTGPDLYTHGQAHEMLTVLRGVVEVSLGQDRYVLEEGDSIEYPTNTPHRTVNIGNGRAEVMWIIAPPTSARTDLEKYVAWQPAG